LNFFSLYKRNLLFFFKKKNNVDTDKKLNLSLEDLLVKYGSDKANSFKNKKNAGHGYTKYYLKFLKKLKYKKINILEIGSYAGASAAAFVKFFPNSTIYCLDINISNFKYISKKINIYCTDATKEKSHKSFLNKINVPPKSEFFDIIIDDGSHKLGDILQVLNLYFTNLKSNGFYIIEDFKLPNFFKHLDEPNEPKIDKLINLIKKKKKFKSKILKKNFQNTIFKRIDSIHSYHGLSKTSDIAFLKKN
tara:strand:- start:1757 stop:2500 length:744 start_codon:yes stop_codon:yes gene_type:complete